jgi:hypothetical protein
VASSSPPFPYYILVWYLSHRSDTLDTYSPWNLYLDTYSMELSPVHHETINCYTLIVNLCLPTPYHRTSKYSSTLDTDTVLLTGNGSNTTCMVADKCSHSSNCPLKIHTARLARLMLAQPDLPAKDSHSRACLVNIPTARLARQLFTQPDLPVSYSHSLTYLSVIHTAGLARLILAQPVL